MKLATVGAFDSLAPGHTRGDLIAHARSLTAAKRVDFVPDQFLLPITPAEHIAECGTDLDEPAKVAAELEILHTEVTAHVLDPWREFLDSVGVVPANQLLAQRNNSSVLVAGVRVASGSPPTKTGQRVVFVSLDDGTGVADIAFFDDAQKQAGPNLFQARLMLVQGHTRRTGLKGVSITADAAWDLKQLANH